MESFESTTQVRGAGGVLLGTVYMDIRETEWGVAIAYGRVHHPKLRGPEPVYEVRYSFRTGDGGEVTKLDTREESPSVIGGGSFPLVDTFALWALKEESGRIGGTSN